MEGFLCYNDLLGKATLFFFRELLYNDNRTKNTINALQKENLLVKICSIKTIQIQILTQLQQQLNVPKAKVIEAIKTGNISTAEQFIVELKRLQNVIDSVPQRLETAVNTWQKSHHEFIEFSHHFSIWAQLLNDNMTHLLDKMKTLEGPIREIKENLKALLQEFRELKQRFDLSTQVKPQDEFTLHSLSSSAQIQNALAELKRLPLHDYQLSLLAGIVVSSSGEMAEAEQLFMRALDCAQNKADKALAFFNLFQIRLRCQSYSEALADLQSAIKLEPNYALHDIRRYPIKQLLGAGSMGCVFLCEDKLKKSLVAIKCFWEKPQCQLFEAMNMDKIAGEYIAKPLDCTYVNVLQQEKAYFVTEYIDGALDGEAWIERYGKLDVSTSLEVGIQIAKCLQIAHEHKISHLNLKPTNLLLKQTKTGLMVKIIDFGMARVVTSLRDCVLQRNASGKTPFGQSIVGTLYYLAPEQMGESQYSKPGAKSDLYAFGTTLYRLMSGKKPKYFNPQYLADAPPELFDLLCDCKKNNPAQRPPSAQELLIRLKRIKAQREKVPFFRRTAFVGIGLIVVMTLSWFGIRLAFQPQKQYETSSETEERRKAEERARQLVEEKPNLLGQKQIGELFRDRLKDDSLGPQMVVIPAGQFRMGDIQVDGDDDEKPVHKMSVERFAIGRYEVTHAEFVRFLNAKKRRGSQEKPWFKTKQENSNSHIITFMEQFKVEAGYENHPVIEVSWYGANAYAEWLSVQTGQKYRLPTEAEWEYAARAGTITEYWWGGKIGENKANCSNLFCGDHFKYTAPVGYFAPNAFGLYDTVGNVWEWTCSEYGKYKGNENKCQENVSLAVIRGGSWYNGPMVVRAAVRYKLLPVSRNVFVGFRIVRE
jgi:formylglycine-generating enzyme required for sulfatase activity/DnaJ-domain-containing protein 1